MCSYISNGISCLIDGMAADLLSKYEVMLTHCVWYVTSEVIMSPNWINEGRGRDTD